MKWRRFLPFLFCSCCCFVGVGITSSAAPIPIEDPTHFFTNVASRLLSSELGLSLNNMQLFPTNQYTPAVHRLLQVAANLYDAATNRSITDYPFLPTVFRPLFTNKQGAIYICGYTEEPGTNILNAPLRDLENADDRRALSATDMVRGIPAIIGARKGFPAFNELAMQTQVSVTRRLQFRRASPVGPVHETNQMYVVAISNSFGMEAWNSYQTAFPRDLLMLASVDVTAILTNELGNILLSNHISAPTSPLLIVSNTWLPFTEPNQPEFSFLLPLQPATNTFPLLTNSTYSQFQRAFVPYTDVFERQTGFPVPHWWLRVRVQAQFALVDSMGASPRIVDYVNLDSTDKPIDITELLERNDPSAPPAGCSLAINYVSPDKMWCTNRPFAQDMMPTYGVMNQIRLGLGQVYPDALDYRSYQLDQNSGAAGSVACQINFFRSQFDLSPIPGPPSLPPCQQQDPFFKTNVFFAPFVPRKDIYYYTSWHANDPLIHYTVPDLTDPDQKRIEFYSTNQTPLVNLGHLNYRYKPWGFSYGPVGDTNRFNAALKDPVVSRSDSWSFPTNGLPVLDWLGQVHRGTPWQTIYLKSSGIDSQTWTRWTGDTRSGPNQEASDSALMFPTNDWRMASLLVRLLRTNGPSSLHSANQPDPTGWEGVFDGIVVLSNTAPAQFQSLVMLSNSPQAAIMASALDAAKAAQPGGFFSNVGDLFATSELSMTSPWLDQSSGAASGISDEAFEKVPAQLLLRLRPDSIGVIARSGSHIKIHFSGDDGYAYAIQASSNLHNWTSIATNIATNGGFEYMVPGRSRVGSQFFRSVLLP